MSGIDLGVNRLPFPSTDNIFTLLHLAVNNRMVINLSLLLLLNDGGEALRYQLHLKHDRESSSYRRTISEYGFDSTEKPFLAVYAEFFQDGLNLYPQRSKVGISF